MGEDLNASLQDAIDILTQAEQTIGRSGACFVIAHHTVENGEHFVQFINSGDARSVVFSQHSNGELMRTNARRFTGAEIQRRRSIGSHCAGLTRRLITRRQQ